MTATHWGSLCSGIVIGSIVTTVAAVATAYKLLTPPHEHHGTVSQAKGRSI